MATTPVPGDGQQKIQENEERKRQFADAVQKMEPHLSLASDGTLVLNVKSGADVQVDETLFNELKQSLDHTNSLIRSGKLKVSQGPTGFFLTNGGGSNTSGGGSTGGGGTGGGGTPCAGQNAVYYYWWGSSVQMDHCIAVQVEALLQEGAGVAALAAILTSVIPAIALTLGVLGGLAAIYQGAIQYCDQNCGSQGVRYNKPSATLIGWVSCPVSPWAVC